jgi:hypothetical protein
MIEWQPLCEGARDLDIDGDSVVVRLGRGRQQRLAVTQGQGAIELSSVVARPSVVAELEDAILPAWKRNRASTLVGFRLDHRGRLVGESWVPNAGLTRDEFLMYVRNLAAACDLFEFQLTGRDRE